MTLFLQRLRNAVFAVLRRCFQLVPLTEERRAASRQWFLEHYADWVPITPRGPPALIAGRRPTQRSDMPAIGYVPWQRATLPDPLPATLVAFFLPQFHRIPANDAWWGEGFTEWRNVTRALPQFEGHAQPRLPGALGFYDLDSPDTMHRQVKLAREYGIGAFCFYFYWFNGKRLLDAPLQRWLADPSLNLPFCLCWANESWSRRWDGRAQELLIEQHHSPEDDLAFIAYVARYLRDPRHLRVDGKPLLLIYRPGLLPEPRETATRWRSYCRIHGIGEIFLAYVQSFDCPTPDTLGFDAAIEFPPNLSSISPITSRQHLLNPAYQGEVLDWRELAAIARQKPMPDYKLFPGVNPGWDNEARRPGAGRVYLHASPRGYRDWLQDTIQLRLASLPESQRLVFINAWNEWAEGAVLEPDQRLGHAWLHATRQALQRASGLLAQPLDARNCAVIHAWYPDVFSELVDALHASALRWRLVVTTCEDQAAAIRDRLDALDMPSELEVVENRGRDILPFLHVADRLLNEGVEVVLKLHTKRSPHRKDGEHWRRDLVHQLLSPSHAAILRQRFDDNPNLGMIGPSGHLQPVHEHVGANTSGMDYLIRRLGLRPEIADASFIGGSMFWVRLDALRPLLDAHLFDWEFEREEGQLDGTLAHAMERIFGAVVNDSGYSLESAAGTTRNPPDFYSSRRHGQGLKRP